MPPLPASATIARERRATTRAASSSDNAPATQAAAISPWEWPITADGRMPQSSQTAASDTITANSSGWTTSTRSASTRPCRASSSDQSVNADRASPHSAIRAANTGEESSSSRAMPCHCDP